MSTLRLADVASELAAALLALILVRLAAPGPQRTIIPALVVATIAAIDTFRPHAALVQGIVWLLPLDVWTGLPVRRLVKVLVLAQVFGSAAVFLFLATPARMRPPLLLWLFILATAGVTGEVSAPLLPVYRSVLGTAEEVVETIATLLTCAAVALSFASAARAQRRGGVPLRA